MNPTESTRRTLAIRILRPFAKYAVAALLMLAVLGMGKDVLYLNPAERVAVPYLFNIIGWETSNLLDKWVHRLATALPWTGSPDLSRQELMERYVELGREVRRLESEVIEAVALAEEPSSQSDRLKELKAERLSMRDDVEEALESTVSAAVIDEGLGTVGELIWPPVDIRLTSPPSVLVTSPRDRIERVHEALLVPNVEVAESEAIEQELLDEHDLSALVVRIGGIATVPASIPDTRSLHSTLQSAAHEWMHHYLVLGLRPLGLNMFSSGKMVSLNETFADMVGRELGDDAFRLLGGDPPRRPPPVDEIMDDEEEDDNGEFDFRREMRETRLRTDELLEEGKIEDAEAYMEERRQMFVDNGFFIRKINQAFFAFNGTYAERSESVSPIGGQLREFRSLVPDLKSFVETMAGYGSYEAFLGGLEALRASNET